jgi:prepilin-type N-terminal cleavage/methylation domain-containing protein
VTRPLHLRRFRGFTLVEVLIAVALNAVLLIALAMAFNGSANGITRGNQSNDAVGTARLALDRMLTELRTCDEPVVTATSVRLKAEDFSEQRTYSFDEEAALLTMTIHDGAEVEPVVVLARNVTSAAFSTADDTVSIRITVGTGDTAVFMTGSATPRRFVTYE